MADDANKMYIQLSKEISELDKDLTRGLASVGYMAKSNKTEIDSGLERIKALEKEMKQLQIREAADDTRLKVLEESKKEQTGSFKTLAEKQVEAGKDAKKQQTEQLKARLAFWGPIVLLVLTNLVSLLLHWAGVSSGD